jgi:hypothetical protein
MGTQRMVIQGDGDPIVKALEPEDFHDPFSTPITN